MSAGEWPFAHRDEVRFGDLDTQGHLNNVAFLYFVESARVAYARDVAQSDVATSRTLTFLVVELKISYRSPGQYAELIETRLRPSTVGRTSFRVEFEMAVGERLLADGYSVLVCFNPTENRPTPVPERLRARLLDDGAEQT